MNRQEYWLSKGYKQEQIDNHLSYERYKSKLSRERRKRNNEKNKDIIVKIKKEIVGKTFDGLTIMSIRPTVDGVGFFARIKRTYTDGNFILFRNFCRFDDYSLDNFLKFLV